MKPVDVDKYLNKVIPHPRYERWPRLISRFFGYRDSAVPVLNDLVLNAWILVSSFAGMIVIQATFKYGKVFQNHHVPYIVPSWAATAILIFNAIESPLGQPRNVFIGTFLSSLVGVCLTKLFMTNSANEEYLWVCGALAVGVASAIMRILKIVHPPAGAAAMIPAVDAHVRSIGWYYLPVQLLSSVLIIAVACIFNNVQRRYPVYWWTDKGLAKRRRRESMHQIEKQPEPLPEPEPKEQRNMYDEILITADNINLPEGLELTHDEEQLINRLQDRIVGNEGQELNRKSQERTPKDYNIDFSDE
jgi:hypothetical protein